MAITSFPFDSDFIGISPQGVPIGDRGANSLEWAKYVSRMFSNGFFLDSATSLKVETAGGMNVKINEGCAMINGRQAIINGSETVTLPLAASLPRIDFVVLRLDLTQPVRAIVPAVVSGTPAATPSEPSLTRNDSIWELALAKITVPANVAQILAANIQDVRYYLPYCGKVTFLGELNAVLPKYPKPLIAEYRTAGTFTWTKPEEYDFVDVFMLGAGGNAADVPYNSSGTTDSGGGGAGYHKFLDAYDVSKKTTITIVIGNGGAVTSFDGITVNPGANSTLSNGGAGSSGGGGSSGVGGVNGANGGNTNGGAGQGYLAYQPNPDNPLGSYGAGGGGAAGGTGAGGIGGKSDYGDGGNGGAYPRGQGTNATGNGCGGGGSHLNYSATVQTTVPGGKGSPGMIQIYGVQAVIYYIERRFKMKSIWVCVQTFLTMIGGAVGVFLGGYDGFVYSLIVFVIIDYITGLMSAIVNKKVSSSVGFRGIFKKIMIFAMVAVAHIIDTQLIGSGEIVRTATIFFYLSNEGISILENAGEIGLPIPQKLKDILTQIRKKGDGDDEDKPDDM